MTICFSARTFSPSVRRIPGTMRAPGCGCLAKGTGRFVRSSQASRACASMVSSVVRRIGRLRPRRAGGSGRHAKRSGDEAVSQSTGGQWLAGAARRRRCGGASSVDLRGRNQGPGARGAVRLRVSFGECYNAGIGCGEGGGGGRGCLARHSENKRPAQVGSGGSGAIPSLAHTDLAGYIPGAMHRVGMRLPLRR